MLREKVIYLNINNLIQAVIAGVVLFLLYYVASLVVVSEQLRPLNQSESGSRVFFLWGFSLWFVVKYL